MMWNENSYKISFSFTFRKCFSFYPEMRMKHPVLRHGSPETVRPVHICITEKQIQVESAHTIAHTFT
jgi:hypothetical protein